jgi:polyisoprenyl-phosphate glycosyltransferase
MTKITNRERNPRSAEDPAAPAAAPLLSVVIPMHNEADNVEPLLDRLIPVLDRIGGPTEIVAIDDGSRDETVFRLKACRAVEPRLKIVCLSRNFGKEVALAAGLAYARGAAVVLMDADLQHPPELIEALVDRWRAGYDMVYGVRRRWRRRPWLRRVASDLFYHFFSIIAKTELPRGAGDFRLLDRRVVDALNACTERSRFNNGLYAWVGFRHVGVPFDVGGRVNGRSGWSVFALWRFAVDAITSFSMMPLRIWSYLGGLVSLFALSYGTFIVLRTLLFGRDVPGYASLIAAITFFAGVQLISLGVIGEYLGRVYTEVKRRPLFVVGEEVGFDVERSPTRAGVEEPLARAVSGSVGRSAPSFPAAGP